MLENEHTELFVGTGKAAVTPYLVALHPCSHATDSPLVELRQQLSAGAWRGARTCTEPEDHVSGVCETMRFAIAVQQRSPEEQKAFFERFVYRGGDRPSAMR